jgi:hydroxyethylthiazole kinase-like uncharacterized protein yjeF
MAAVTIAQMRQLEASAMATGISEEALLNAAGEALGMALGRHFPNPGTAVGYLGKGHNAGDTLVALRILRDHFGWNILTRQAFPLEHCAPLTRRKWQELHPASLPSESHLSGRDHPLLLLDGLLGIGATGPLRPPLQSLAQEMAHLRATQGARIAAIDTPSGIDPDRGELFENTVIADITFMIGCAKRGLLLSQAATATGALAIVEIPSLSCQNRGDLELITPQNTRIRIPPRPFDFHKGLAGRVAILAGSDAYTGAAALATAGALRGGGGLVTLFTPASSLSRISAKCSPEAIIRSCQDPRELLESRFDALVIGCGLDNFFDPTALVDLLLRAPTPVVIDAGALDVLAKSGKMDQLTERHVLTPHPGEFARIAPDLADLPRETAARRFTDRHAATLLLKGCRTLVTRRGHPLWCNATGTPAMASGGQGDLLAGVIGARLAAGTDPLDAASLAAWICGRAAEIAMTHPHASEESLLPSDMLPLLGAAFNDWKRGGR